MNLILISSWISEATCRNACTTTTIQVQDSYSPSYGKTSCRRFPEISRKTSTFLQAPKNPSGFWTSFLRWPWQDHYLGWPSTKQINRSYLGDPGWFRFACCATLARVPCVLVSIWCILRFTVRTCVKGSKGFRCITSLLWVFCLSCSFGSCQAFPEK